MANHKNNVDLLVRDLVRLLGDQTGLHVEMIAHMRDKLVAMRAADADAIQAITSRELQLAEKAAEREGLRRQIARKIVEGLKREQGLSIPGGSGHAETMKLSELAEFLPEPRRSQLITAATGLKVALLELQRLQRTNLLITQETLKHLRHVVAVMCGGGPASESYSRGGQHAQCSPARVFEAVG